MRNSILLICLICLSAMNAWAGMAIPGEDRFENGPGPSSNSVSAGVGYGAINEDQFLKLQLRTELNFGPVGLGLQLPINLRLVDNSPHSHHDYGGIIRREDWDEPSEYLRILRYLRLGNKGDAFFLRVGEIAAEIGHGTIMSRYTNNLDLNSLRVGLQFDVNTRYGGFESVVGDVGTLFTTTPQSRLVGGRLYFKPMSVVDADSVWNIFSVGASVVTDTNAPLQLASGGGQFEGHPKVNRADAALVYGFDTDVAILRTAILDLTPYIDFNLMDEAGWGSHFGLTALTKVPIGIDLRIPMRLEYRRFKNNYMPAYFSTFYEVERYQYAGDPRGRPKSAYIRDQSGEQGLNGYFGDIALDFVGVVQLGAIYEDYQGGNPNMAAYLNIPALKVLQFKAYYARTQIKGTDDFFALDNRSLAVVQVRYQFVPFMYFVAQYSRRWALAQNGKYAPKDEWNVGTEASVTF